MNKHIQNKVAESRYTLPVMAAYAIAVWIATGLLIPHIPFTGADLMDGAWVQLICFVISTYLIVELNNSNALIRIYSRMVSCSFLAMSCAACFLFSSMEGAIAQLCIIAAYTTIFRTYQHKQSTGWTFYAFLCLSLGSIVTPHLLYFVPVIWILMLAQLNSLSWRTFFASLLGLATPYWFAASLLVYMGDIDFLPTHFLQLAQFQVPFYFQLSSLRSPLAGWHEACPYSVLSPQFLLQAALLLLVVVLFVTGVVHYWRNSSDDKIRIRQLYGWFIAMSAVSLLFLVLQPQHYDLLMRMLIINVSPLIAHFISLTNTKVTNIAFFAICIVLFAFTVCALLYPF